MEYVFVGGKPIDNTEKHVFRINLKEMDPFNFSSPSQSDTGHSVKAKTDFNIVPVQYARNTLISIIDGLNQKSFGFNTLNSVINDIRIFKRRYTDACKADLFVDSGGYSIIVGDVPPTSVTKFIECYNHYLLTEKDVFDYIFSLDIPIFLNNPEYNTISHIENFNRLSLSSSLEILKSNPELQDKFYFIYQFKVAGQYPIWDKLYNELSLGKYIKNWAIGGMVGMRGILRNDPNSKDINFSPFTAIAFKSLFDYIHSVGLERSDFRLHCLGIYIKYDRFQLVLLEHLFKQYLMAYKSDPKPKLTYDSVNYMRTAQLKVKTLDVFNRQDDTLLHYKGIQKVPYDLLQKIYGPLYENVLKELEHLNAGQNLMNIDAFTGLNVYSNVEIDKFFDFIIKSYRIVDIFFDCRDFEHFKRLTEPILITLSTKWPVIFTPKLLRCIRENFRITYIFHYWITKKKDLTTLNSLILDFVKKIGFPGGLI